MNDYTPTTEEVRNIWRASSGYEEEAGAEFDRWLDSFARQKQADVLRGSAQGLAAAQVESGTTHFDFAIFVLNTTANRIAPAER